MNFTEKRKSFIIHRHRGIILQEICFPWKFSAFDCGKSENITQKIKILVSGEKKNSREICNHIWLHPAHDFLCNFSISLKRSLAVEWQTGDVFGVWTLITLRISTSKYSESWKEEEEEVNSIKFQILNLRNSYQANPIDDSLKWISLRIEKQMKKKTWNQIPCCIMKYHLSISRSACFVRSIPTIESTFFWEHERLASRELLQH